MQPNIGNSQCCQANSYTLLCTNFGTKTTDMECFAIANGEERMSDLPFVKES